MDPLRHNIKQQDNEDDFKRPPRRKSIRDDGAVLSSSEGEEDLSSNNGLSKAKSSNISNNSGDQQQVPNLTVTDLSDGSSSPSKRIFNISGTSTDEIHNETTTTPPATTSATGISNTSYVASSATLSQMGQREDTSTPNFHAIDSTTNLLGGGVTTVSFSKAANDETVEIGRRAVPNNTNKQQLLPQHHSLAKEDLNSASTASMDTTRLLKYGLDPEEQDLLPLIPIRSSPSGVSGVSGDVSIPGAGGGGGGSGPSGDSSSQQQQHHLHDEYHTEKWYHILFQVIIPFIIAGYGMVGAGIVLDIVQHWELYQNIKQIYTLVPALLGLKGNLEMTLAARLSTHANLGKLKDKASIFEAILGNFALTQAQSIVVGFLASIGASVIKALPGLEFDLLNTTVLVAGSLCTASFASILLAGLMMSVIILSKHFHINPDNIATPIAASLGDLVTLAILSYLTTFLYEIKAHPWVHVTIICIYLVLVPIFVYYSHKNDFVRDALYQGWIPIILAMIISSVGGYIMGKAIQVYNGIAVYQPVVNGVGGNLVAIFASRLSTALHRTSAQGTRPFWCPKRLLAYPYETFFSKLNPEANTAKVLITLAIPGHLLFYLTIYKIEAGHNTSEFNLNFTLFYLFVSFVQVCMLLLICYWFVHFVWQRNNNPDNICIPYLTAIGDLLGTALLALCFHVLFLSGQTHLRTGHTNVHSSTLAPSSSINDSTTAVPRLFT